MNNPLNPTALPETQFEDDTIDLVELATDLGNEKKLLLGLPTIAAILSIGISLLMSPVFTAKTTLLPPSQSGGGGAAAALAQLGALSGLAGGIGGIKTPDEQYVAMLKSRSVADMVIDKYDLQNRYELKYRDQTYKTLDQLVKVGSDKKSGLLSIEVDDKDPQFAAELANGYAEALQHLLTRVAVTDAQLRRKFFEEQFAKAKDDLSKSEVALKELQEKSGVIRLDKQAESTIQAIATIRAEIAKRDVQLAALRNFATSENPEFQRITAELGGLRNELRKLEQGSNKDDKMAVSASNLPQAGLDYVRALREVKYNEAIFEIMAKQFELAKIDESKEGTPIQQLDPAVAPELKSKPKRGMIVVVSTMAAAFAALLIAFVRIALRKSNASPESQSKLQALRKAWGFGK